MRYVPAWLAIATVLACGPPGSGLPAQERVRIAAENAGSRLDEPLTAAALRMGDPIFIRIFKEEGELEVWLQGEETFELLRTYDICYYSGDLGPKLRQGDLQSPEGFYFVTPSGMNPASRYHLSFDIGYPNELDRGHGRTGSAIMVHGRCVSIGCFAMTDPVIEEIYTLADAALRSGQPFFRVHVFPFRMTESNMRRHRESEWYPFWVNLKEGYDDFERRGLPPDVRVERKRYVFGTPGDE